MENINPIEMGERIKRQRLLLGYSREHLAELASITPRYCYDIELGLKNVSLGTLSQISEALHLSTDYILFGEQEPNDKYRPVIGLIETCPDDKLGFLERIVSYYIAAVNDENGDVWD